MTSRLTESFSLYQAKAFIDSFDDKDNSFSMYAFTSNSLPIGGDENNDIIPPNPPIIQQDALESVYKNALTAKKIDPSSLSRGTKRFDWVEGQSYQAYRSDVDILDHKDSYKFYCFYESMETQGGVQLSNVYKCLYAPEEIQSNGSVKTKGVIDPPTSVDIRPFFTADGYGWKYMYSITSYQKNLFLTED